jgi:hypothetical protein
LAGGSRGEADRPMLIFDENLTKLTHFYSPISGGTVPIIPLQLVLSRKIFKKVTKRIFPPRNVKIPASLLEN